MNIRAVRRDREITTPEQSWVPGSTGEGQSRVSAPELRLHYSPRQDRQGSFTETQISQKMMEKLQC